MDIQKIYQYKSAFDLIAKSIKDDEGNTIEVWYARELQHMPDVFSNNWAKTMNNI